MNEEQIRERMRRNREDPPEWKRELLRQIDSLASMPGSAEVFREHVQAVAESLVSDKNAKDALPGLAEGESMSAAEYHAKYSVRDLLGPGPALTLPEKYFILAAFHDALCEAERMPPIMEWDLPEFPEYAKDPRFPAFCMYRGYVDDCADRPDNKLQPDTLRRYVEEVKGELVPRSEAEPVKTLGEPTQVKPGRKKLTAKEEQRRRDILERWERASSAGVSRERFCDDENITVKDLENFQRFFKQRENRRQ